jgi:hypothetical protein
MSKATTMSEATSLTEKSSLAENKLLAEISPEQIERIAEFERLNEDVKDHIKSFRKAGNAFIKIIAEKLWDVAYNGWEEYRDSLIGYNCEHIARLVYAAKIINLILGHNEANPKKKVTVPEYEWQIRAIPRKLDDNNKIALWSAACDGSEKEMPTHNEIEEVRKKMFPSVKKSKPQKKKEELAALLTSMMTLLDVKASHDEIQLELNRLIKILKVKLMDEVACSPKNPGSKNQRKLAVA